MRPIIEAKGFPQSAFRQGVPVTREGMAVFLVEAMEAMSEGRMTWDLLESAFLPLWMQDLSETARRYDLACLQNRIRQAMALAAQ